MNKRIKDLWIKALNSLPEPGEFHEDFSNNSRCSIGVLSDLWRMEAAHMSFSEWAGIDDKFIETLSNMEDEWASTQEIVKYIVENA